MKLVVAPRAAETLTVMTDAGILDRVLSAAPLVAGVARMAALEKTFGLAPDPLRRLAALAVHVTDDAERFRKRLSTTAAYDVTRIVSSSSTRCVETVAPYSDTTGWKLELQDELSEEDASAAAVAGIVGELVDGRESAVVCSHRPVLPSVYDAIGVPDPKLAPGAMLVVHVRKGDVVATECHQAR